MLMPGRRWYVPLSRMSHGIVEPTDALSSGWNGGVCSQNRRLFGFEFARSAQLFVAVRSVVRPPKMNPPLPRRAFTLTSTPLYTRELLSEYVRTLFTTPRLAAFRL